MNPMLAGLYAHSAVNAKRIDTDRFFIDELAQSTFSGHLHDTAKYIEAFQLLDPTVWARFVEQFRIDSDVDDMGWRGEYWGKMMRGASFTYSYTKNPELYRVLTDTVKDMLSAQQPDGRISAYNVEKEFEGWDTWCRKYVLLGMQYYLEICTDEAFKKQIIASMCRQVDYMIDHLGEEEEGKKHLTRSAHAWRGMAASSVLEPVVRLYDLTGESKYLDFAQYIYSLGGTSVCNIFDLAYEDKTDPYQYPITKAYEMISCFEGLLELYRATGVEKYKTTVINFARRLAKTDITIIGSAGCTHEYFDHAAARQTDTAYQGIMQETCVTVTWMKFCMQILLLTGDASFAEAFETSLYNAYLGSVNTEKCVDKLVLDRYPDAVLEPLPFDSYASLLPNTRGRGIGGLKLMPDKHYYGCCACIGSAGIGMMHKVATQLCEQGVVINLFIPGSVCTRTPSGKALTVLTETAYPADGKITFRIEPEAEEAFSLLLRIPSWSMQTSVCLNGQTIKDVCPGTYCTLSRSWKAGDTVTLDLDMRTRVLHPVSNPKDIIMTGIRWLDSYVTPRVVYESPDAPFHIALLRGPLVLARDARLDGTVDEAVDVAFDENGFVEVQEAHTDVCPYQVAFTVPQKNGKTFTVIDYASAGKTWDERSKYACWLPTKEYWRK